MTFLCNTRIVGIVELDIRFSYIAASSLDKALGQGVIHMAKSPYTIVRRQPGSCTAYTRTFTYHIAVYLF